MESITVRSNSLVPPNHCALHRGTRVVWAGRLDRLPTDVPFGALSVHPDDYDTLLRNLELRKLPTVESTDD